MSLLRLTVVVVVTAAVTGLTSAQDSAPVPSSEATDQRLAAVTGLTSAQDSAPVPSSEAADQRLAAPVPSSEAADQRLAAPVPSSEAADQRLAASSHAATNGDGKIFLPFVYSSTVTRFSLTSITSTVPFTCFNNLAGTSTPCTGRRRRRRAGHLSRPRALEMPAQTTDLVDLQPSVGEDRIDPTQAEGSRLVLTSWITVVSSMTSVSTITKFDTTVSLALLCSIGGTSYFSNCLK